MSIKNILLLLCILLIVSCKRDTGQHTEMRIQRWLDYYDLTLNDFEEVGNQTIPYQLQQEYSAQELEIFVPFFVYNPDSTKAIDLDSYHLVLEKLENGKLYASGRDVDMEAGLIDFEKSIRTRLLFCGPACLFEEGSFPQEGIITITGFADDGMGYTPVIWEIDPITLSLTLSASSQIFEAQEIRYTQDVRLDNVIFARDPDDFDHLDVPL